MLSLPIKPLAPASIQIHQLTSYYPHKSIPALDKVSLSIAKASSYALIGESGSGKSSLVKHLLGLLKPQSGEIMIQGQSLSYPITSRLRQKLAGEIQLLFQDPLESLHPRWSIYQILAEPLKILGRSKEEIEAAIFSIIEQVQLDERLLSARALQCSGGQRQRIALARALLMQPKILILDEAFASLDLVSVAQMLHLLKRLQKEGMTLLSISHDLELVGYLADRVGVMYKGRLIEEQPTQALFTQPKEAYTKKLLDTISRD